jgi:cell division septation protein DedD
VFFTMGYIVGRHSSPAPAVTAAASNQEPAPAGPASSNNAPAPGQAAIVMPDASKSETPRDEPAPATRPATAPAEAPRPAETRAEPPRAEPPRTERGTAEPLPGRYLQVAAPKRVAADAVVESLRNKGIKAVLAPGPNEDTVRILVGPLDAASFGKMRMDLESAGFKPFAKTY